MIYRVPEPDEADLAVLHLIDELRTRLRYYLVQPRRWFGTLRRATLARSVQGSNSIEGYHASDEDVAAMLQGEEPLDADTETRHAIVGYRDAMTYVLQRASDPPVINGELLKSLHFMLLRYDLRKNPGQWRPGAIRVVNERGKVVYEAPDRDQVEPLIEEMADALAADTGPVAIRAAMAHLNLTLIHPFSDGNGRMARCLQTLVLASNGVMSPEFCSIEEYLGHNTTDYYAVLNQVSEGSWSPHLDANPWVRFCLTAHYRQAGTLLRRIHETEALWDRCEQLARTHRLSARVVPALCDGAHGWRLRRSLYVKLVKSSLGEDVTDATATRDLRGLVDAGLFVVVGERRGRQYFPADELQAAWEALRAQRVPVADDDPYLLAEQAPGRSGTA